MLHAYEGYLEKGKIHSNVPLLNTKNRLRVIITVLDEPMPEKQNTWEELDKVISNMAEKPFFEDFPRCQTGRGLIDFEEV